jgi:hypothetical protein
MKHRSDNFFGIEENRPITIFILIGGADSFPNIVPYGYTSKGLGWVYPIGTHFIGKRIGCTSIFEPDSCYICEQIRELEEEVTALKQKTDEILTSDPDETHKMFQGVREPKEHIKRIRCQQKYAINVLVQGQDMPVIYGAPRSVAERIYEMFESALSDGINIFDPLQATSFTVSKTGDDGYTWYTVKPSPGPLAIITGERHEERIKKALLAGANFDDKYKLPTRAEQVAAWDTYINLPAQQQARRPVASPAEFTRQRDLLARLRRQLLASNSSPEDNKVR